MKERQKLLPLLHALYKGRHVAFEDRLIIEGIAAGSRLKMQGIELMHVESENPATGSAPSGSGGDEGVHTVVDGSFGGCRLILIFRLDVALTVAGLTVTWFSVPRWSSTVPVPPQASQVFWPMESLPLVPSISWVSRYR